MNAKEEAFNKRIKKKDAMLAKRLKNNAKKLNASIAKKAHDSGVL